MIKVSDIKFGSYKEYEGPYFRGSIKYSLPDDPSEEHKRLAVITATEGGAFDAVNMYDRCIVSVGLIQWCEARYYLVSKMLHEVAEKLGPEVVRVPLEDAMHWTCSEFKKNSKGQWRFFFKNGDEVDDLEKQQKLFLNCNGKKGSWDNVGRMKAKLWATGMANIWQNPEAREVQAQYTARRVASFATREARDTLWDPSDPNSNEGWVGAMRAGFLSFAANLPAVAGEHVKLAADKLKSKKWSKNWCIGVLQELTFGPNIAIYPHRYDKIRPVLENLWDGVELPKTANDLRSWTEPDPSTPTAEPEPKHEPEPEEPKVEPEPPKEKEKEEGSIVLREPTVIDQPTSKPNSPQGALGWILFVLSKIMQFFFSRKG